MPFDLTSSLRPQFGGFSQQSPPLFPPLSPEEEDSILSKVGAGASDGLAYVGGILDKTFGGRAIRGLLGGKPRELLSIIPGSDKLGLTREEDIVHGSDLIGADNPDFFSPEGLAGFALDIALDPGTYLSFGAKGAATAIGKAAQKAGVKLPATGVGRLKGLARNFADSPEGLAWAQKQFGAGQAFGAGQLSQDMIEKAALQHPSILGDAEKIARKMHGLEDVTGPISKDMVEKAALSPLGGHAAIGLPFGLSDNIPLNLAPLAPVAKGVGNFLLGNIPGGHTLARYAGDLYTRGIKPMFNKSVMEQTIPELQNIAGHFSGLSNERKAAGVEKFLPLLEEAHRLGYLSDDPAKFRALNDAFEGAAVPAELKGLVDAWRGKAKDMLTRETNLGLSDATELMQQKILSGAGQGTDLEYLPRQLSPRDSEKVFGRMKLTPAEEMARRPEFRGFTKNRINDLAAADFSGLTDLERAEVIRTQYLGLRPDSIAELAQLRQAASAGDTAAAARASELEVRVKQSETLSRWKKDIGDGVTPYFGNHPLQDILDKMMRHEERVLKAEALHSGVAAMAEMSSDAPKGSIPLVRVLQDAGLTIGDGGAPLNATLDALRKRWGNLVDDPRFVDNLFIPKEAADSLTKFRNVISSPQGVGEFLSLWDGLTNLTKTFQTAPWPANHVRNQMTAFFQHWINGAVDPTVSGPLAFMKPWTEAKELRRGGVIADANQIPGLRNLTPEAATAQLQRELQIFDVQHRAGQLSRETVPDGVGGLQRLQEMVPGTPQKGFLEQFAPLKESAAADWKNPFHVSGGIGFKGKEAVRYTEDVFPLAKTGRNVASYLDDINRVSAYIAFRRQGFEPLAAAERTLQTHFDFTNLTRFEKAVPRRLVPFYGWLKQSTGAVLEELAARPGGKAGVAVRAGSDMRGQDPGFIPDYLGGGVVAKVGSPDETGTQRFLTSLGLPIEDLGQTLGGGLSGLLGNLNPLIKFPIEQATGKQLHTGRDLADLHSMSSELLGQPLPFLENALMNSPFGRVATTARTLMDDRKDPLTRAINVGTGLRFSDIDMNKAKLVATRDYIENALRGAPGVSHFERMYVRPDQYQNLSPWEIELLRLNATMDRRAAAARRP